VLLFPGALRALESAFHNGACGRAATLRASSPLSIPQEGNAHCHNPLFVE
jgi:hypothetical protein